MAEMTQGPLPDPWRPITIHVTREIAHDLSKMQKITASVLERLGCPTCHSGHILNFQQIRDFVVNPKTLDIREMELPGSF